MESNDGMDRSLICAVTHAALSPSPSGPVGDSPDEQQGLLDTVPATGPLLRIALAAFLGSGGSAE